MDKSDLEAFQKAMNANYEAMKEIKPNPTDLEKSVLDRVKQLLDMSKDFINEEEKEHIKSELEKSGVVVEEKGDLINITQTAGISDFIYNMRNIIKNGKKVETFDYDKMEDQISFVFTNKKGGEMELSLTEIDSGKPPVFTDVHLHLLLYTLQKDFESNSDKIYLEYEDLCKVRGLRDTPEHRMRIRRELKELDSIFFDYRVPKGKKTTWIKKVRMLAIWELNRDGLTIQLGDWKNSVQKKTFIQLHKGIFGYKVNRGIAGATPLSYKLRDYTNISIQEYTRKKKPIPKSFTIKICYLLEVLGIEEAFLKKHGVIKSSDRFEKYMREIESTECLQWEYKSGDWKNYKDFMNDFIIYSYKND